MTGATAAVGYGVFGRHSPYREEVTVKGWGNKTKDKPIANDVRLKKSIYFTLVTILLDVHVPDDLFPSVA